MLPQPIVESINDKIGDDTNIFFQLCDSEVEKNRAEPEKTRNGNKCVYSAPLSQIGSSTNLQNGNNKHKGMCQKKSEGPCFTNHF